jgi:acyl dehydratase
LWVKNPATGITWTKLVHSAQNARFHRPLPAGACVYGKARISEIYDRRDKGAVLVVERSIYDAADDQAYCTLEQTLLLRADGGFGGEPPPANDIALPDRPADKTFEFDTSPGQAIIYRLSGDWNPLHIDPEIAKAAGFPQPILHGYCSYAIAGWVASQVSGRAPCDLKQLACQFSGVVLPGDRLSFECWQQGSHWLFNAKVGDRTVLNRGLAMF